MAINKIKSTSIEDDAITSAKVADGVISAADVADGTITSAKLSYPLTTFSSTGIDDNATSTAITIDSSENVGINQTSPEQKLDVNAIAQIKTQTSSTRRLRIKDSVTSKYFDIGVGITSSQPNLIFYDEADERMRIDSSGHAIIPGGVTLGTSAGTYNAANTLDDYEEGTWQVDFTISGSSIGSFNNRSAYYTKIGNVVYVNASTQYTGSSLTGSYIVGQGLPFTISSQNKTGVSGTYQLGPGSGSTNQSVGSAGGWNEQDDFFMVPGGQSQDRYINAWTQNYYINVAFWYYTDA